MDPKEHANATWVAVGGPDHATSLSSEDAAKQKEFGHYELTPLGGEDGFYWKWVTPEDDAIDPADDINAPFPDELGRVPRCGSCRWGWQEQCHLNPPGVPTMNPEENCSEFPVVEEDDWCSHFSRDPRLA